VNVFEQKWHLKCIQNLKTCAPKLGFDEDKPMRRLASVLPDVVRKVLLSGEGFGAVLALVRRLSGVLPHVVH
jgi:hypothetical protein